MLELIIEDKMNGIIEAIEQEDGANFLKGIKKIGNI